MAGIDKITFIDEDNEEVQYYIMEQTKLNGFNYILVTDDMDNDDAEAFIMKDISKDSDAEAIYEFVEDDAEIEALGKIFGELLEDIDLDM